MITSDLAQLFQLPTSKDLFGMQGLGQLGGQFSGEGGLASNLFSGVLQNVLSSEADLSKLGPMGQQISEMAKGDGLSPEELEALKNLQMSREGEGAEGALIQITQIITVVYEEFTVLSDAGVNFDGLNSTQELAAAYMQSGMSAEEANSRAARLTMMMLVMDNRISMADMLESLTSPQELGLQQKHQSAFIHIEQTISKFTLASTGSHASLSEGIRNGASLQDMAQNMPQNAEKASQILANLASQVNGKNAESADAESVAKLLQNQNGQASQNNPNNIFSSAFGRMENLLTALADEAAKHPEGADLSRQLKDMAGAVNRISQNVIDEGGLQQLEANLPQAQANLKSKDAGLQSLASQTTKQTAQDDANQAQKVQENIKAQISEEQPLPEKQNTRMDRSETLLARGQGAGGENNAKNSFAREPAMVEPQNPSYIVRPSAAGGVEVFNPQTGETVQATSAAQNAGTPSFSSNTGEGSATLTQSRGLEAALQARLSKQVSVHVRTLAGHGGGQIVVGLNPPEMGRIQVRLEILDGAVKGAITVQRADVAETIARDMRALETAFKEMGLDLGQEGISVQLEQNPSDKEKENDNNREQGSGTRLASTEASGEDDDENQGNQGWINPDRLLDVSA